VTLYVDNEGWVCGDKLFRVGFMRSGYPLIRLMSGLVDVLAVAYDQKDKSVNFIVNNKDQTNILFKTPGGLVGQQISRFRVNDSGGIVIQI
jgi:hypothetical protein